MTTTTTTIMMMTMRMMMIMIMIFWHLQGHKSPKAYIAAQGELFKNS
jgi:hypothetical protein